MRLGATHLFAKPWRAETLALTIKVALREGQAAVQEHNRVSEVGLPNSPSGPALAPVSERVISTGGKLTPLERVLGGGISLETLTLVEGSSAAGKSVLCQDLVYGAILGDFSPAYFTTEHTAASLSDQMISIGLDISAHLQGDKISIYPLENASLDENPEDLLAELASDIERVRLNHGFIIVDGITNLAQFSRTQSALGFFTTLQRQCSQGRTIVVVARTSAFAENLLHRLSGVCDSHIGLGSEIIGQKLVNTLEVLKVGKTELKTGNRFSFQVEPTLGIQFLSMSRVKA